MIASEFLNYRARLSATLAELAEAARASGAPGARANAATLRQLVTGLQDPFLIAIAGERGAGKSVLANAVAGAEFCDCEIDEIEGGEPGSASYYRFGEEPRDVVSGGDLVESFRPCAFLRDFQLVELPGSAAPALERFVTIADIVLVVISATDAWTPGAWSSLDQVHLRLGKDVVVVLGSCDLRSEDEVRAVVEHMGLTMEKRYGGQLPVFPVSAEHAFLARTHPAAGDEEKFSTSGIMELEKLVSVKLLENQARRERLGAVIDAARRTIDKLRDPVAETEQILGGDSELLHGLKEEINGRYESTNGRIRGEFFDGLDEQHAAAVEATQAELLRATGWGSVLRQVLRGGEGQLPAGLGDRFRDRLVGATEQRVVGAMGTAEEDVSGLWERLSERVGEKFDHRLSASDGSGKAVWSGRGESLLKRAAACATKACHDFDIAAAARERLRVGGSTLRFFAVSAVLLAIGAGYLAVIGLAPFYWIVGALALVALGFGAGQFIDNRRRLRQAVDDRAAAGRIQLRADLSDELTSHVHEYYTKLGTLFDPVQALAKQQVEEVAPKIARLRELEAEVQGLAEELPGIFEREEET